MARMFSTKARLSIWAIWLGGSLLAAAAAPAPGPVWPPAPADPYIV